MEITFVINIEKAENLNHIERLTKKCKDFNDGFRKAYNHIRMRYKNVYPVVKFTIVNIEFC